MSSNFFFYNLYSKLIDPTYGGHFFRWPTSSWYKHTYIFMKEKQTSKRCFIGYLFKAFSETCESDAKIAF